MQIYLAKEAARVEKDRLRRIKNKTRLVEGLKEQQERTKDLKT